MKRLIALLIFGLALLAFQVVSNCAQPLDDSSQLVGPTPGPRPGTDTVFIYDTSMVVDSNLVVDTVVIIDTIISGDTLIIVDTIYNGDTLVITDTIITIDTVLVIDSTTMVDTFWIVDTVETVDTVTIVDTIIIVDTVEITLPDTSGTYMLCSRIGYFQKKVVWMFRNEPGQYLLEFSAHTEHDRPARDLLILIGDQEYLWPISQSLEYDGEYSLDENEIVIIKTSKPCAFGHPIDVCVTITRLEPDGN